MDTPTSFSQIARSQILRTIISYLPKNEQLNVRLVSKCWNNEARYAMDKNGLTKIRIIRKEDMDKFLRDFPSTFGQLDLTVAPASMSYQQLETFGTIHGSSVVLGDIWLPEMIENLMEVKARLCIKYWTNIQKLSVRYSSIFLRGFPCSYEPQQTICSAFPSFEFLRELCVSGVTTELELMRDVLNQTPAILKVHLEIMSTDPPIPTALRPLLDTLCQVSTVNLDVGLNFPKPDNNPVQPTLAQPMLKTFLDELKDSGLVPRELRISLIFDIISCNLFRERVPILDLPSYVDAQLQPWLKQVSESGLDKLAIRTATPSLVRMNISHKMTDLKVLDLGFHYDTLFLGGLFGLFGLVEPMELIKSCQVPNLETIVSGGVHNPMSKTCVFPQVTRLRLYPGAQIYKLPLTLWEDFCGSWVTQFPNLTAVDILVTPRSYGATRSLFSNFGNLTELKMVFERILIPSEEHDYYPDNSDEESCDVVTGGFRPIMDAKTSLAVVKGESTGGCGSAGSASAPAGQPSIKNLRNLKVLDLFSPPDCVVMAIIHFTATKAIPSLNKLKMTMVNEQILPMVSNCLDILLSHHGKVDITATLPVAVLPNW